MTPKSEANRLKEISKNIHARVVLRDYSDSPHTGFEIIYEALLEVERETEKRVREETIKECAKFVNQTDHCDLPGHRCTHEISEEMIVRLFPSERNEEVKGK